MADLNLENINLEKYEKLAMRLMGSPASLAIFDIHDSLHWHSISMEVSIINRLKLNLGRQLSPGSSTGKFTLKVRESSDLVCFYSLLKSNAGLELGRLFVVLETETKTLDQELASIRNESLAATVADLADIIQDEVQLSLELNSMAGELTDRYEELNLVYSSGDDVSHFFEGQAVLRKLVVNCHEYMNVDIAALILPDKHITYIEAHADIDAVEVDTLLEKLHLSLYPWICTNEKVVAINSLTDPLHRQVCPDIFFKLMGCPIFDGSGAVCGLLVVLNQFNKKDFSNSARNLLEVVGRKAAKIIQSSYDKLTGLLTRSSFESVLDEILHHCPSGAASKCLLAIKIDQLNIVNDLHGLVAGDAMIREVAKALLRILRQEDVVGRIAGNMIGIVLDRCTLENSGIVAKKLQQKINQIPFCWEEKQINIKASFGVVPITPSNTTRTLLTSADLVIDLAKQKGGNRIEIFRQTDQEILNRKSQIHWVNQVQEALVNDSFELFCQGIYPVDQPDCVHHYEILIRMLDDSGKVVSPANFLPAAEYYKLMPNIDRWVITHTLRALDNHATHIADRNISWAINLSGQTLSDPEFCQFLVETISQARVPAHCLSFEITESATIDNLMVAQDLIAAIKGLGSSVYLDDFGTGLSSFSYLQSLPFDYVKIDGCFIRKMEQDPVSVAMISAICSVTRAMGLHSVAEYVEAKSMIPQLKQLGIDFLQGYALHKPEPVADVLRNSFSTRAPVNRHFATLTP